MKVVQFWTDKLPTFVQAKPKRVTQKKAQPVVESRRTVAVDFCSCGIVSNCERKGK